MDERAFYSEVSTTKPASLNCPHCRTTADYDLRWIVRRKKDRLPGNADERDRARFAKAQSYMVLMDDKVMCANLQCRKRFDVSGIKTMAFVSEEQEAQMAPAKQPQQQRAPAGPPGNREPHRSQQRGKFQGRPPKQHKSGQQQQKQKQQQQKKKKPKVYFPSDYIYYRP